jgi:hypothetical protein
MAFELYLLVPAELAEKLLVPLREHFEGTHVEVIVDRRDPRSAPSYTMSARRRRHLPRSLGDLPPGVREHANALQVVQRMAPAGLALADAALLDVVRLAARDDGQAATELSWRIYHRVEACVHPEQIDATLGAVLDRLKEFAGSTETQFFGWLNSVLAPPAMAGRMTSVSPSDTSV